MGLERKLSAYIVLLPIYIQIYCICSQRLKKKHTSKEIRVFPERACCTFSLFVLFVFSSLHFFLILVKALNFSHNEMTLHCNVRICCRGDKIYI